MQGLSDRLACPASPWRLKFRRRNQAVSPLGKGLDEGGCSAESCRASRRRFTALFKPRLKSTNVPVGHSRLLSSSRLTTSPGRSSKAVKIWKAFPEG